MELKATNINFNYDNDYNIKDVSISLGGNDERNSVNAYIVLPNDENILDDLTPKQMAAKAKEKLKELIGEQ
jgi:serine protease inhibitor